MPLLGIVWFRMGPTINVLSQNVRGLNSPEKRGNVKWVLRRCSCDIAILQESKMEVISRSIAISLWGRRPEKLVGNQISRQW